MNFILNRVRTLVKLTIPLAVLVATAYCSKEVPVENLAQARVEIGMAEQERAADYASEDYEASREALLEAHRYLAEEDYDAAGSKADEAHDLARSARITSAPRYTETVRQEAEHSIARAGDLYAEQLAAAEFNSAIEAKIRGDEHSEIADENLSVAESATDEEQQRASLDQALNELRRAYRNYESSIEISNEAIAIAQARIEEIDDGIASVEAILGRAADYKADQYAADSFNSAKEALELAKSSKDEGRFDEAASHLREAEEYAMAALVASMAETAERRLAEARSDVDSATESYSNFQQSASEREEEITDLSDYVAAAGEAVDAAEQGYRYENYENSIQNSDEAIRIAAIIRDQLGDATAREDRTEDERTTERTEPTGDRNTHVVQRTRPAESLWRIAGYSHIYGNPTLWPRIWRANRELISDPDIIYPGQELRIPEDAQRPAPEEVEQDSDPEEADETEDSEETEETEESDSDADDMAEGTEDHTN